MASPIEQGGDTDLEKGLMTAQPNQNPMAEPSPSPSPSSTMSAPTLVLSNLPSLSPSSTASAPVLVLSNTGKRIDQTRKKKYVKQVMGRHNDTELHLATQPMDLAAVKKILGEQVNRCLVFEHLE